MKYISYISFIVTLSFCVLWVHQMKSQFFFLQFFYRLLLPRTTRPTIGKIFSTARCLLAMEAADISWNQGAKNIYLETNVIWNSSWNQQECTSCMCFFPSHGQNLFCNDRLSPQPTRFLREPKMHYSPCKPAWQGIDKPEFPGLELTVEVHACFYCKMMACGKTFWFLNLISGDLWTAPSKKWRHWVWCWQWCCRPLRRGLFETTLVLS